MLVLVDFKFILSCIGGWEVYIMYFNLGLEKSLGEVFWLIIFLIMDDICWLRYIYNIICFSFIFVYRVMFRLGFEINYRGDL